MSSVQALREFINQRLTAAAGEIFTVFEQTIVRYEEEIDRQRRLLEICWKPQVKLHRTELPQQDVCPEEQGNSRLELDGPVDPPQIKEEQEEVCSRQGIEQLQLTLESSPFMTTVTNEHSDLPTPEAGREKLGPLDSAVVGGHDLKKFKNLNPGLSVNTELKARERCHGERMQHSPVLQDQSGSEASRLCYEPCSESFSPQVQSLHHHRPCTGERRQSCEICVEDFSMGSNMLVHMRSHTGEKPYSCQTCGKSFGVHRNMVRHMSTHTGEKPYSCAMCSKSFSKHSNLLRHYRTHTGEKPFPCALCDKSFRQQSHLLRHRRTHRD